MEGKNKKLIETEIMAGKNEWKMAYLKILKKKFKEKLLENVKKKIYGKMMVKHS